MIYQRRTSLDMHDREVRMMPLAPLGRVGSALNPGCLTRREKQAAWVAALIALAFVLFLIAIRGVL